MDIGSREYSNHSPSKIEYERVLSDHQNGDLKSWTEHIFNLLVEEDHKIDSKSVKELIECVRKELPHSDEEKKKQAEKFEKFANRFTFSVREKLFSMLIAVKLQLRHEDTTPPARTEGEELENDFSWQKVDEKLASMTLDDPILGFLWRELWLNNIQKTIERDAVDNITNAIEVAKKEREEATKRKKGNAKGSKWSWDALQTSKEAVPGATKGDPLEGIESAQDLLRKLIPTSMGLDDKVVVPEEDDAFKQHEHLKTWLSLLLERSSVVVRAKLYSRLIAVACKFLPIDISRGARKGKSGNVMKDVTLLRKASIDREKLKTSRRSAKKTAPYGTLLAHLLEALEEDDNFMTLLYVDPLYYTKKYPVPYFDGCTEEVVLQISNLWFKKNEPFASYLEKIIEPIIESLDDEELKNQYKAKKPDAFILPKKVLTHQKFKKAKNLLCKELQKRGAKAGARLLQTLLPKRIDNPLIGELVKDMFNQPRDVKFKKHFLQLQPSDGSKLSVLRSFNGTGPGVDKVQSINVGLTSSYTDYNLLCWAARRGYKDLIWLVVEMYKPPSKFDDYYYVNYLLKGTDASWKCALWCATRHGQKGVILEILAPEWIKENIDFSDYPRGWLPPLHLVALLGDVVMLKQLSLVHSGAHKKDYWGRTPLDYAMPFMTTTNKIFKMRSSHKGKSINMIGRKDVIKKLLHLPGVEERLKELYNMYINQANTVLIGSALIASAAFFGWLQPPLGYTNYYQFKESVPTPKNTYEQYVAIEGHLTIQLFVIFNTLSFFSAITTMFIGAEVTLFVRDKHERTSALYDMRNSIRWMMRSFILSMLTIIGTFICAGLAIMPPIPKLRWNMIGSFFFGGMFCIWPLFWIFSLLSTSPMSTKLPSWIFIKRSSKLTFPKDCGDSLVYSFSKEQCKEFFNQCDINADGSITATELLKISTEDIKWAEVEVRQMMAMADEDNNYHLTYEEFESMFIIDENPHQPIPSSDTTASPDKAQLQRLKIEEE